MFSTVAGTDVGMGFGPTRLLVGLAFSLGLILVVVGGAELFTGNNLIVMAWAHGKVSTAAVLRNWAAVLVGNFAGAAATALGVDLTGAWSLAGSKVAGAAGGADAVARITWEGFLWRNLLPVTLGNVVGGAVMVGLVYWFVYLRARPAETDSPEGQHIP